MKTLQLAVLTLVMSFASQAAAQYTFGCYPETEHDIGPRAPNTLMMLDMSGSMNVLSGEDVDLDGIEDTRYKVARLAISEVANSTYDPGPCPGNCDSVRLGLAYFPSSGNTGAASATLVGEDTAPLVTAWLSSSTPTGGTPTGDAMSYVANTAELRDPTRPNIAILITDGEPSATGSAAALAQGRNALNRACEARNRTDHPPVTTYVLGFGSSSNEQVNSAIAAAGGTGMCCAGATAPCALANQIDPCAVGADAIIPSVSAGPGGYYVTSLGTGFSCTGSLEATGSDIKDQLLSVLAETSCIFDIVPPGYSEPGADPDPAATVVRLSHTVYGEVPIPPAGDGSTLPDFLMSIGVSPALANEYLDEGWEFTNVSRRFVRLSPKLCEQIQLTNVTRVTTQLACVCPNAGDACDILVGGFTPSQSGRMRCGAGVYVCSGSTSVCTATVGAMPEVCNGIDDDCDGLVDNMSTSWNKPAFSSLSLPPDKLGIDCLQKDVCMCPNGPDTVIRGTDFTSFVQDWQPICQCGEGLQSFE